MSDAPPPAGANDNAPEARCPICGKPVAAAFRPFCSRRCKDVDLHRWFSGRYALPAREDEGESPTIAPDAGDGEPRG
jgi:endogenous inhibitor of DNA gyrase (YacG/DUF329 family)